MSNSRGDDAAQTDQTLAAGLKPLTRRAALAGVALALAATQRAAAQSESAGPSLNLIRDTEIEAILHQDADPIFAAAGLDPKVVQIHLIGDHELNAFVAGGQHMFINTGLIEEAQNPNQLIGVMAHETGHMAGGHLSRSGDMEKAGVVPMVLTIGLGVAAALAGAPGAAAGLIGSSTYFGELNMLTYSRQQEARADQAAITYLTEAHVSARGLVDFFENFRSQEVFSDARRYPFFRSHPLSSERIDLLRSRAEEQPCYHVVDSPEAIAKHAIMKAKLDGFMNPPDQTFAQYTQADISFPARYARAIAYYRSAQTDKALAAIDALLGEQPESPYLWELKGQTLFESGRAKEAEAAHRRSVEILPDAPLLRVNLAQAILGQDDAKRAGEALGHLKRAVTLEADNAFAWRLMAQAYAALGQEGEARLAAAEESFALGDKKQAEIFAMRARDRLPKGTPQWRRATDIVLTVSPDGAGLAGGGGN